MRTLIFASITCLFTVSAHAQYGGGSGTADSPYLIYTPQQLYDLGTTPHHWDKHFRLMADIDLGRSTKTNFRTIGTDLDGPFQGTFDGNGHTISNATYILGGAIQNNIGLFGYVYDLSDRVTIRDLGLIDPNIDALTAGTGDYVGSLVGCLFSGTIVNCYAEGGRVAGRNSVGGLIGGPGWTAMPIVRTIEDCHTGTRVSGINSVGGLIGSYEWRTISRCYATGNVSGYREIGGFIGSNGGQLSQCYSTGRVLGVSQTGGFAGLNDAFGEMLDCYAAGRVLGDDYIGGLAGVNEGTISRCWCGPSAEGMTHVGGLVGALNARLSNRDGTVAASFWDMETSGQTTSAGGTGRTTAEMQMASTFLEAGWDFVDEAENGTEDIWWILEGQDYPRLWWEPRKYGGGTGKPNDPYLIYTPEQMNAIGAEPNDWDRHFKLMADIDLGCYTGEQFHIIGNSGGSFIGSFDGNGHALSNFNYRCSGRNQIGLFGAVGLAGVAVIQNVELIDPNVDAASGDYVGSLVGYLCDAVIENCHVVGGQVSGGKYVGGLIGGTINTIILSYLPRMQILGCHTTARVSGAEQVGGLIGFFMGSSSPLDPLPGYCLISGCDTAGEVQGQVSVGGLVGSACCLEMIADSYSYASVSGDRRIGGLLGSVQDTSVKTCYASGQVVGIDEVGGLAGRATQAAIADCYSVARVWGTSTTGGLVGKNQGTVSACYAGGPVTGESQTGGLIGSSDGEPPYYPEGSVSDSFWDVDTSGQTTSAGGTGKTTAEMQTPGTFLEAGWDFVDETANGTEDFWWILEGHDYPRLGWEQFTNDAVLFVVDDFESYDDEEGNRIFETWIEPYGNLFYDMHVGHYYPPYAETTIVHGGSQSMPFYYCNTNSVVNSGAQRDFYPAQDWTTNGADTLSLWFRGAAGNGVDALCLTVRDSAGQSTTLFNPDPNAVVTGTWTPWHIPLRDLTAAGLNTRSISGLEIGVGDRAKPSRNASGILYIDDIGTVLRQHDLD